MLAGHVTAPILLSVTTTFERAMLPVLVTVYVHVITDPTGTIGPVGLLLSVPFVFVTMVSVGVAPK